MTVCLLVGIENLALGNVCVEGQSLILDSLPASERPDIIVEQLDRRAFGKSKPKITKSGIQVFEHRPARKLQGSPLQKFAN